MKKDYSELLFLPLDLENAPRGCLDHMNNLSTSKLYQDDYRNCWHIPMMYDFKPGKFIWTPFAYPYKELREWVEDVVFPVFGISKIAIITTPPGYQNPPHIDCSKEKFYNSWQHKFRFVLQGNVDDLVFMGNGNEVSPTQIDKPFVMSGSWPHYMTNTSEKTKFTLALGAPWDGNADDKGYIDLLDLSIEKYKDYYIDKSSVDLPKDYESLFEENWDQRSRAKEFFKQPFSKEN